MRALLLLASLSFASPAKAALTADQLSRVAARPPPHARLPMSAPFRDAQGRATTLGRAADGAPLVLVFADYACTTLCGPALGIEAARLIETDLTPGRDFRLAVIGLDPRSTPAEAREFGAARLRPDLLSAATLMVGDPVPAARAAGYGYVSDDEARDYAHPIATYVLAPDGRVARVLSEVAITGPDLREAIVEAKRGRVGALFDQAALVCHGALVAVGRFDHVVVVLLRAGGVALLVAAPAGLAWLSRRRRRTA